MGSKKKAAPKKSVVEKAKLVKAPVESKPVIMIDTETLVNITQTLAVVANYCTKILNYLESKPVQDPNQLNLTPQKVEAIQNQTATEVKSEAAVITKEQVEESLQRVSAKFGLVKVKEILNANEASKISELKSEKYPSVYNACAALV